jgi:hypothetical protein
MENETQTTLRDTITDAFDTTIPQSVDNVVTEEKPAKLAESLLETPAETPEQKADRLRDEKGRFAKTEAEAKAKVGINAVPGQAPARPQRPSSWKKDMWEHWEKLDPKVAEYMNQREQEFSKGVSTYKNEWEQAKPLMDVIAQFQPIIQQANLKPHEFVAHLGNAHRALSLGSPQQRIQAFTQLAKDYNVPLQELMQGAGETSPMQYINPLYERINQVEGRLNTWQSLQEQAQQADLDNEINSFKSQHDHFETVRETMAGLLQAKLANNLKDAYDAAIRLPKHADIFDAMQQQQRQQEEAKRADEANKRAKQAKANAISPRSATPSGQGNSSGKKGLREQLSENLDEIMSSRV